MDRRSLRSLRIPQRGPYVSPYAKMETPAAMSSPTESLTSTETGEPSSLPSARHYVNNVSKPGPSTDDSMIDVTMKDEEQIVVDAPSLPVNNATMLGVEMYDDLDDDEDSVVTPQHKRKRTSINYNLDGHEQYFGKPLQAATAEPRAKRRSGPKVRGIIIGVWRDSSEPNNADKHVIFGFIDVHDRLRTRIYSMNRRGEELIGNAPTGAGGCWVTFERVIFEPHLEGLTSTQVKEYVKLRAEVKLEDDLDARHAAEIAAVIQAKKNATAVATNPPETKIPTHYRRSIGRTSMGRESVDASVQRPSGFQAVNSPNVATPKASAETKTTTGVPLGYWADSDEPDPVNKHAVFGVVSESDCFRVKVQRVTRDGRTVIGNFPTGAGAMWIKFDQMVVEPNLSHLTRPELKEFCRIRQRQLITAVEPETHKSRLANEKQAMRDAKSIISAQNGSGFVEVGTSSTFSASGRASPEPEVRHSARSELKQAAKLQAEAEAIATRARQEKAKAQVERNETTRKEVAIAEALAKNELKQNINSLNKVWVAQQNATMNGNGVSPANSSFGGNSAAGFVPQQSPVAAAAPPPSAAAPVEQEVKFHNGIRYERKTMGPFAGKLVGGPQIFNIDGEDYVEYRILTKPSFA